MAVAHGVRSARRRLAQAVIAHRWLARVVPFAAAAVVVLAGALQFTAWKVRRLACCRSAPDAMAAATERHGCVRLGLDCACRCGNLMAISLVAGMMDLRTERLLPAGERVARGVGLLAVSMGVLLIVRAIGGAGASRSEPPAKPGGHFHGIGPGGYTFGIHLESNPRSPTGERRGKFPPAGGPGLCC